MSRIYVKGNRYYWEAVDKYGYPITESEIRDIKINSILDVNSEYDFDLYINIRNNNESLFSDDSSIMFTYRNNKLRFGIYSLKLTLHEAEDFIDKLINDNAHLEVYPIYLDRLEFSGEYKIF